ncbi:inorganic diphosphatase [Candidatus Saccharibacteria bacterium]|nr:inorganic diphosphatase [Candidatus Saccharibacteria bacterium]MCB9821630.1 inorganic diphosphatase [Candidatus Nomurabacteria bacterium]
MGYPFNQLSADDGTNITTVIEIPKGSMLKVEWDRKNEYFALDRVEPGIFAKPVNYGFIPQTLDEDGDELDTLVVTGEPLPMGVVVECKVIGILNFEDDAEMDHKVVCVPADDRHYGPINNIDELGEPWKKQIEHHFNHYKDLKKPGSTKVLGFGSVEDAWKIIGECKERAQANPWW